MKISVTPLRVAFAFMMTPAGAMLLVFYWVMRTGNEQLILIMLTNVMSFYQGMASTSSTMMTGRDFFKHEAEQDDTPVPPAPSKVTEKSERVVESFPEPPTPLAPTPEAP